MDRWLMVLGVFIVVVGLLVRAENVMQPLGWVGAATELVAIRRPVVYPNLYKEWREALVTGEEYLSRTVCKFWVSLTGRH